MAHCRKIEEVIHWILGCPVVGENQRRMVTLLRRHSATFDGRNLKYTVSMYIRLNAKLDDGKDWDEIMHAKKWFTLQPTEDAFLISMGIDGDVVAEKEVKDDHVPEELEAAICFLAT